MGIPGFPFSRDFRDPFMIIRTPSACKSYSDRDDAYDAGPQATPRFYFASVERDKIWEWPGDEATTQADTAMQTISGAKWPSPKWQIYVVEIQHLERWKVRTRN